MTSSEKNCKGVLHQQLRSRHFRGGGYAETGIQMRCPSTEIDNLHQHTVYVYLINNRNITTVT